MCFKVANSGATTTTLIKIAQTMNCAIALNGAAGSSLLKNFAGTASAGNFASIPFVESGGLTTLSPYDDVAEMFYNKNSALCGPITSAVLKISPGCSSPYLGTNVVLTGNFWTLQGKQDVNLGYDETLCIEISNAAGSIR